jgi:hypothetical protein
MRAPRELLKRLRGAFETERILCLYEPPVVLYQVTPEWGPRDIAWGERPTDDVADLVRYMCPRCSLALCQLQLALPLNVPAGLSCRGFVEEALACDEPPGDLRTFEFPQVALGDVFMDRIDPWR